MRTGRDGSPLTRCSTFSSEFACRARTTNTTALPGKTVRQLGGGERCSHQCRPVVQDHADGYACEQVDEASLVGEGTHEALRLELRQDARGDAAAEIDAARRHQR